MTLLLFALQTIDLYYLVRFLRIHASPAAAQPLPTGGLSRRRAGIHRPSSQQAQPFINR
jgi:hypothetical protein